ncbi:NnrS family protein [Methylotuvimicrobium sp. KM1]|uniref:NnrS family protein n=1 Tax=Methylotuvimicrobium sp. KM1 TaxID=3377707 RepID=UPI0038518154
MLNWIGWNMNKNNSNSTPVFDYPVFGLGFRPFFILAGLFALLLILLWNAIYKGELSVQNYYAPNIWHAHEMLVGYSVAVIAGFLLTAVKNWTGQATASGDRLAGLCLLWLYGRILPFYAELLPDFLIALTDFAFLPVLAYSVSQPIMRSGHNKSLVFIVLLALMTAANALVHLEMLDIYESTAMLGLNMLLAIIIVMILVVAGRVFPFFTERGLKGVIAIRNPLLDVLSIVSAASVFLLQMAGISGHILAVSAIAALVVNLVRIAGWHVRQVWYVPLLWILYIGYGWIILGFGLTVLAAYAIISYSLVLHAFTLGGIGVLTLGMMVRVSLGHTGRVMKVSNIIVIAFVLLNLSAFVRVILPALLPTWYGQFVYISTLAWLAAFALFVFVYAPILLAPRIDGKPD